MCYLAADILLLLLFETVSHYGSVTAFEVLILQAHPYEFLDYRHALPDSVLLMRIYMCLWTCASRRR